MLCPSQEDQLLARVATVGVATASRSQSPPPPNNPSALTISLGSAFDEQMDLDEWFNNTVPAFFGTLTQGPSNERSFASSAMDYETNIEGSALVRDLLQPPLLPLQPNVDEDYHQQLAIVDPLAAFQLPSAATSQLQLGSSGASGFLARWPYGLSSAAATSLHSRTPCPLLHSIQFHSPSLHSLFRSETTSPLISELS